MPHLCLVDFKSQIVFSHFCFLYAQKLFNLRMAVRWKFVHSTLLSTNQKTADQSKFNTVISLVEVGNYDDGAPESQKKLNWCLL